MSTEQAAAKHTLTERPNNAPLPLLVLLCGPTASGKTALAVSIAERFGGEIISCDSVAVYRGLEIGSAKPTAEERARAPHHLLDVYEANQWCTAGDYSRLARNAIAEVTARGHLPIVSGGTGLYLRALTDGLFAGPPRSEEVRARLERSEQAHGTGWLHRVLSRLDRRAAQSIHPHDRPKLIRAIEVCVAVRKPMTEAWQAGRDPLTGYRILRLGLNPERKALYARINARARAMFDEGLVEETAALMAQYSEALPTLDALGYRQAQQLLRGEMTREVAIAAAQQGHRNYAKRQFTWFRREPEIVWLAGFGQDAEVQHRVHFLMEAAIKGESILV